MGLRRTRIDASGYDKFFRILVILSAFIVSVTILFIVLFIAKQGFHTFGEANPVEFFLRTNWNPPYSYGALTFIVGSFAVTFLALAIAGPIGAVGAVFVAKVAPRPVYKIMRPALDFFVGIPSVVYGWVGLSLLRPFIQRVTGESGYGLLLAGIILGVMILPTVITIAGDSLRAVPKSIEKASYALGATRLQTTWRVLLPAAAPGLITALIVALTRAIGETVAVQMVIGNSPLFPTSLLSPASTLTSQIVTEMATTPFGSTWNDTLFFMALTLLLISLSMVVFIRLVVQRRLTGE